MTQPCVPTQNNCQKSGTGPGCSSCQECGSGAKRNCLDEVKKQCDERLKKCIEKDCIEQNVKAYERDAQYRADQRSAQLKQEGDRFTKCAENNSEYAYQSQVFRFWFDRQTLIIQLAIARGWNSSLTCEVKPGHCYQVRDPKRIQQIIDKYTKDSVDDKGQKWKAIIQNGVIVIDGLIEIETSGVKVNNDDLFKVFRYDEKGKEIDNQPSVKNRLGGQLGGEARATFAVGNTPGEVNDILRELQKKIDAAAAARDKACPPIKGLEPFDELEAQRAYNQKIARCIGACHYQAMANCKTSHCYCGSYKCDAGKQNPAVGDNGGTDFPTTVGADPTISTHSLSFTASSYALPIELMYTRSYFAGNVLWVSPVTEVRKTTITKKLIQGTTAAKTTHYLATPTLTIDSYISYLLGICAGPIDAVQRIWLGGNLIYDVSADAVATIADQGKLEIKFFNGSEAANSIGEIEAIEGFGKVPAERGVCCVLIKNLNLKAFTAFPQFKIEVVKVTPVQRPQIVSGTQANGDVSKIWRIDTAAQRVYIGKTDPGMRVIDYGSLETIREINVAHAADVSPLPYVITTNGTSIGTNEIVYATQRSVDTVAISFTKMFQTRILDLANTGYDTLVLSNTSGDIYFYSFIDRKSTILAPSDWQDIGLELYAGFDAMLSGALEAFANTSVLHTQPGTSELILSDIFFGFRGQGGTIEIAGFAQNSTSSIDTEFLELGNGFTFTPLVVAGASTVHVIGAYPCDEDRTIILFLSVDSGFKVMKLDPFSGAVWVVSAPALPTWGSYEVGRRSDTNRFLMYIASGVVYKIDLDDGSIIALNVGTFPAMGSDQRQYFDCVLGAITYYTSANTVARIYAGRISFEEQTITDVLKDVATRAGFDPTILAFSNVDDVPIKGYRSGTAITARQVLEPLFDVYPVDTYIDIGLSVVSKGNADSVNIDDNYIQAPFSHTRNLQAFDTRSAALTYFSIELDGELATQTFQLPEATLDVRQQITAAYTILEDDDYMLSLAELKVYSVQENDSTAAVELPPRYLSVTPSDQLIIDGKAWRAVNVTLGANLLAKVDLALDANSKYNEFVALTGSLGFGNFFQAAPYKTIPFPLMWSGRCVLPDLALSGCVMMSPQKLTNDFKNPVSIGESADEGSSAVGISHTEFAQDTAYGYLVTPPVNDTRAFTTMPDRSMVVKFISPIYPAERLNTLDNITDMYFDPLSNMLLVGQEHIRYNDYSVDMDGVTVTFTGLARARDNTDMFMNHVAGELVMVYALAYQSKIERATSDFAVVKGASVNAYGEIRRSDKSALHLDVSASLPPVRVRRWDTGPAVPSGTYPLAKDINITFSLCVQNVDPLTNSFTAYYDRTSNTPTLDFCPNCVLPTVLESVYFLRGAYNQTTFETWLATALGVFDSYVMTSGTGPGIRFLALAQEAAAFDMHLETLTVVLTSGNELQVGDRTSRRIVKFTPGDYTRGYTRGIVKN